MSSLKSKTVLIVDSDQELQSILAAALAIEGFRTVAIGRTRDAIGKLRMQKFSALFIDPQINQERTSDLFLSAMDPNGMNAKTPLVLMSSNLDAEIPLEAVPAIKAYLQKPFNLDEFVGVSRLLNQN
jgi:DNA-binding NtrC family response regulator